MDIRFAVLKDIEGIDDTPFTFGKYKGKTPDEVSDIKPDYIIWMWRKFDNPPCSEALYNYCLKEEGKWSNKEGE